MNITDRQMHDTILNLEIEYEQVLKALSIYYTARTLDYSPDEAYREVEDYMQSGYNPFQNAIL